METLSPDLKVLQVLLEIQVHQGIKVLKEIEDSQEGLGPQACQAQQGLRVPLDTRERKVTRVKPSLGLV